MIYINFNSDLVVRQKVHIFALQNICTLSLSYGRPVQGETQYPVHSMCTNSAVSLTSCAASTNLKSIVKPLHSCVIEVQITFGCDGTHSIWCNLRR